MMNGFSFAKWKIGAEANYFQNKLYKQLKKGQEWKRKFQKCCERLNKTERKMDHVDRGANSEIANFNLFYGF